MLSLLLWKEMKLLFQLVTNLRISLWAVHIPEKMNVIADLLSRLDHTPPTEWSVNQEATRLMFPLWAFPTWVSSPPDGTLSFQPLCLHF